LDKATLKALKDSIKKWEKIVAGEGEDKGTINCPLCWLYYGSDSGTCVGCPVMRKTGLADCKGTPYTNWVRHHMEQHLDMFSCVVYCEECKKLAKRELEFLKSLLPKKR